MDNYANYRNLGEYDNIATEEEEEEEQPEVKAGKYALEVNNVIRRGLNL